MPRNILFLSAIAAFAALLPAAASAADFGVAPAEPEAGYYGMEAEGAAVVGVEEDDSIVDIDIDLGLFDDDEPETAAVYADAPPAPIAEPYVRAAPAPYVTK